MPVIRRMLWLLLTLLPVLLLASPKPVRAGDIIVGDAVPSRQTNWSETLLIPQFDPSAGLLTSVELTLAGAVSGIVKYESLDAASATIVLQLVANIAIQRPDNSTLFLVVPNASITKTVPPGDGVGDFVGAAAGQQVLGTDATEMIVLTDPADLALFTGTGNLALPATAIGSSSASGPGNVILERQAQAASVVATVKYNFIDAAIHLEKTVYTGHNGGATCPGNELEIGAPGTPVTYCFEITNPGDTYLDSVEMTDADLNITLTNMTLLRGSTPLTPTTLAPTAKLIYYYEGAMNVDLLNTATVTANPVQQNGADIPGLPNPTDSDTAQVRVLNAAIQIQKTVYAGHNNGVGCAGGELVKSVSGAPVTYCFEITNTGVTHLDSITLVDTDLGIDRTDVTLISGTTALPLAPGAKLLYFYNGTLTKNLLNRAATEGNPVRADGSDIPGLPNPSDDDTAEVMLVAGAAVGDFAWLDTNVNGLQDAGEPGLNDVTVNLLDGKGNPTGKSLTTVNHPTTGEPGFYEFTNLTPGEYQIEFVNFNIFKYAVTALNATDANGNPDGRDSDADKVTGRTAIFSLEAGERDLTWDAGFVAPTALDPATEPTTEPTALRQLFLPLVVTR